MNKESNTDLTFVRKMMLIKKAGINTYKSINHPVCKSEIIEDLPSRIQRAMKITTSKDLKQNEMIYFIMYDIENNKIRQNIAKYLEKKGCTRVQKSIFIAKSERKTYDEISSTLKKVQELYSNNDSIFFVPVSTDHIRAMKIIGVNVDFDMVLGNRNTLFF
ncbi:MAG: CRISPR-associated endonuclease Cas2 [Bacteroidales bacterium]|nr:CRISPR-associated endonuclease Cas2 [Bacteroidales bacterium]